jgi:hypothetical protein
LTTFGYPGRGRPAPRASPPRLGHNAHGLRASAIELVIIAGGGLGYLVAWSWRARPDPCDKS